MTDQAKSIHRKRYWRVCQACGTRFKAKRSDAKYCPSKSRACAKYAYRRRQKGRQLQVELEARRQAEMVRQAQVEAEQQRRNEQEAQAARLREQQRREQQRTQTEARAVKAHADTEQRTVIKPCPKCGHDIWRIQKPGLLARHATMICDECGFKTPSLAWPVACPSCHANTGWTLDRFGVLTCTNLVLRHDIEACGCQMTQKEYQIAYEHLRMNGQQP